MSKTVVISGHPDIEKSFTNTVILENLRDGLDNVEIRRLDILYPDFKIDVEAEQQALLSDDIIVLQFPFYWYSVPALMKKWIDDVFSFNFAYGPEGDKLKGKEFFLSFTVGGPEESYDPLGYNHFTVEEMIRPLQQTAYLAGLNYNSPIYTNRMVYIPGVYNKLEDVQSRAYGHAQRLLKAIAQVSQSAESKIKNFVSDWFAQFDQLPEDHGFFIQHLSQDVRWHMPDGNFAGHAGFKDWYSLARKTFKPDCDHQIEQIETVELEDGYQVDLRVRLIAETYDESDLKGASVNMLVNESWKVSFNEQQDITINDYQVTPVAA